MCSVAWRGVAWRGVWCVVCGVWCVVCGVWCVVCGVWCVVCGVLWGVVVGWGGVGWGGVVFVFALLVVSVLTSMRWPLCGVQKRHVTSVPDSKDDFCNHTQVTPQGDLCPFRF